MKLILAIVKPFKVIELVDALRKEPDCPGMTVISARGFGRRRTVAPDAGPVHDFLAHEVVLVAAPTAQVQRLTELITRVSHTGRPGDGKVLVLPLEAAFAITTGEQGEAALG